MQVASLVVSLLATTWSGWCGFRGFFYLSDVSTTVDCGVVDGRFVTKQVQNTSPVHSWRDCMKRICFIPLSCWVNSSSHAKAKVERTDSPIVLPSWHRCTFPRQRCQLWAKFITLHSRRLLWWTIAWGLIGFDSLLRRYAHRHESVDKIATIICVRDSGTEDAFWSKKNVSANMVIVLTIGKSRVENRLVKSE